MSTREKNLLMYFLRESRTDKGCTAKYEKVLSIIAELMNDLEAKADSSSNKKILELESEITELFQVTKDTYFDFGANANEVIENRDLDWTPIKVEELSSEENIRVA